MANYIDVPADVMERFLQNLGFERGVQGQEVIYQRRSKRNPIVLMKIYTSIKVGQTTARRAGTDAIRVCVVGDPGNGYTFGIGRFNPVFRVQSVESVMTRLWERIEAAVKRSKQWMDQEDAKNATVQNRFEEKAAFAAYERAQEEARFRSDSDYAAQ